MAIFSFIILFATALFFITQNLNTETIKNQLIKQLETTLASTVNIDGSIELTLFPKLHLSVHDIHLKQNNQKFSGSIHEAYMVLNPYKLLNKTLEVHQLQLIQPTFTIKADRSSTDETPKAPLGFPPIRFTGSQVLLKHCNLYYEDDEGLLLRMDDAHILLYNIHSSPSLPKNLADFIKSSQFMGKANARLLTYQDKVMLSPKVFFDNKQHQLNIHGFEGGVGQGYAKGSMTIKEHLGLLKAHASLNLLHLQNIKQLLPNNPLSKGISSVTINTNSEGVNFEQLIAHQKTNFHLESLAGTIEGLPIQPLIEQWNQQAIRKETFSALPQRKTPPQSSFDKLSLEGTYHNRVIQISQAHLFSTQHQTYAYGYINQSNNDYQFHGLINLQAEKLQALRSEMNGFFQSGLLNTIPMVIFPEAQRTIVTLDTDYIDVSKLILGQGISSLLKAANYQAFKNDEQLIKADLFRAFKEGFNPETQDEPPQQ